MTFLGQIAYEAMVQAVPWEQLSNSDQIKWYRVYRAVEMHSVARNRILPGTGWSA
jgi:hypothetical protein